MTNEKTQAQKSAEAKTSEPKAKEEKATKEKKITVGSIAMQAIREGKSNDEALAAVKAQKPEAKTTLASIGWYRNKLRADGEKTVDGKEIPTARAVKGTPDSTAKKAPDTKKDVDPLD